MPALPGYFVLDDEPNLHPLSAFNTDPTWTAARTFVESGNAGPLSRPIAMASFLLNASDWPESAEGFRQVNLFLHLANGLLLFGVLQRLLQIRGVDAPWAALAVTALWLVTPANTATTLYIVQRMTLLSSFFMLLGFLMYLHGRPLLADVTRRLAGALLILGGLIVGVGLGMLSKENAITLLLVLLACEATVFAGADYRRGRPLLLGVLAAPVLLIVAYFIATASGLIGSYGLRDFTLLERLMTQPLALANYVINTLLPVASNISIFSDDFPVVTDLFTNPAAALSLIALLAAAVAAFVLRRRHPLAAFAVLGFFAVHALEGSIIALELYFEHRNYLGSAFVLGLAAIGIARVLASYGKRPVLTVFFAYLTLTGFVTHSIALTWGDPLMAAITWPAQRPDSVRAQQFAIDFWGGQGQLDQAEKVAREAFERNPRHLVLLLQAAQMRCARGEDVSEELSQIHRSAPDPIVDTATFPTIERLFDLLSEGRCSGISPQSIIEIVHFLHANARVGMRGSDRAQGWYIEANALRQLGNHHGAVAALEEAHRYSGHASLRLSQSLWLLEAGDISSARAHFERYESEQNLAPPNGGDPGADAHPDHQALARMFDAISTDEPRQP